MTRRYFQHEFFPPGSGTWSHNNIELTTLEISQAALLEITQIALPVSPFATFIEQLLVPNDHWFRWISQLGQIRETRVAFSGLFGRFVARAYLTRYFGYQYYEPLKSDQGPLSAWPTFTIARKPTYRGDLPDWIVASAAGANTLAIAEAKGSYNKAGAGAQLKRAKQQAAGIEIKAGQTTLRTKRFAIATRWAVQGTHQLDEPFLTVHDPEDGMRDPSGDEAQLLVRSVALGHFSALAAGLGLSQTASALSDAKTQAPGKLLLPEQETVEVVQETGLAESVLAGIVTPAGIVPLPRDQEPERLRSSLSSAFGSRSAIFSIATGLLQAIDRGTVPRRPETKAYEERPEDEQPEDLLATPQLFADGSQLTPAPKVTLRRRKASPL